MYKGVDNYIQLGGGLYIYGNVKKLIMTHEGQTKLLLKYFRK